MDTVLVTLAGMTPQIVTETLWALHRAEGRLPRAVHVVTTRPGADKVRRSLLDPRSGWFYRLCRDLGVDHCGVRFGDDTIHVVGDEDGRPLDDIRSGDDNRAVVDTLWRVLGDLTGDDDVAVHASLAGGRKTMTFLMGLAMSLFGREQDRLSHVLVSEGFETHPEFYYKPSRPVGLETPAGARLTTADAEIELVEIPFVRLRGRVDPGAIRSAGYGGVAAAQAGLDDARLELDMDRDACVLRFGGRECRLSRGLFAWYAYLLWQRAVDGRTHRPLDELHDPAFARAVDAAFPHPAGHGLGWIGDGVLGALDGRGRGAPIESAVSRINKLLGETWPTRPEIAAWLSVTRRGGAPGGYGVDVPLDRVRVAVYPGV